MHKRDEAAQEWAVRPPSTPSRKVAILPFLHLDPMHEELPMALALLQLRNWLLRPQDERGASVVEYALLIALVGVVCLVAVNTIGGPTSEGLSNGAAGFQP
jgi:Flp pilus assembly pilin Flp